MTILSVLLMSLAELVGNAHLKLYSENGAHHHLSLGLLTWAAVLFFLVKCFETKSMMWTCVMWEACIIVGGALTAYFIFGEKLTHWLHWFGILFALAAAFCINYCPK